MLAAVITFIDVAIINSLKRVFHSSDWISQQCYATDNIEIILASLKLLQFQILKFSSLCKNDKMLNDINLSICSFFYPINVW